MLVLSSVGCQLFVLLGLLDSKGCDELKTQEENLDTLMWFKLLFVPTLGIIILTLFLLEDYCYSVPESPDNDKDQLNVNSSNNLLLNNRLGKKNKALFSRNSKLFPSPVASSSNLLPISASSPNSLSPAGNSPGIHPVDVSNYIQPGTKLHLTNQFGAVHIYKLTAALTAKELIQFYSQRNNLSPEALYIRLNNQRLADNSVISTGNFEQIQCEIDTDYEMLMTLLREENKTALDSLERQYKQQELELIELSEQINSQQTGYSQLEQQIAAKQAQIDAFSTSKSSLLQLISTNHSSLAHYKALYKKLLAEQQQFEQENVQTKEKLRLEKQIKEAKSALSALQAQITENFTTKDKKTKEISEISAKIEENQRKISNLTTETSKERQKSALLNSLQQQLEQLQAENAETLKKKKELEALEKEFLENQQQLAQLKQLYDNSEGASTVAGASTILANSELENQLSGLKTKHKQLENTVSELAKWRNLASKYDSELQGLSKLKAALKQLRIGEKSLEKEVKENSHWRATAKNNEKRVKELRNLKRNVLDWAKLNGISVPNPTIIQAELEISNLVLDQQLNPNSASALDYIGYNGNSSEGTNETAYNETENSSWSAENHYLQGELQRNNGDDNYSAASSSGASNSTSNNNYHSYGGRDDSEIIEAALPPVHLMAALNSNNSVNNMAGSAASNNRNFDVSNSLLQPSAREFFPRSTKTSGPFSDR
jgi:myosin heavy subunit